MENIIIFLLELSVILYILKYILHISITTSRSKQGLVVAISFIWMVYSYLSDSPLPDTFVIIPIALLQFCDGWYIILSSIITCTLAINIINDMIFYLYCIITNTMHENNEIRSISDCIILAGLLLIIFFINKRTSADSDTFRNMSPRNHILITIVIFINFLLAGISSLLFYINLNTIGRYMLMLAIYIMIAMSIVLLILYLRIQHYHSMLKQTNSINLKMLKLEEQHYRELQKKTMDLRTFRHDYNYHVTAMQGLARNEDFAGLKNYVEHLSNVKEQVYFLSTNHPVADAIVNYFYENIPENTNFQIDGKFPENIFVDNSDICIILSNVLKNATEAVNRLPNTLEKQIYLSCYGNDNQVTIHIENTSESYQDKDLSHLSSSKSDTSNHGFGLKNIRDAVNRYGGKLDLKYDNNMFIVSIYLHNTG